MTWQSSEAEDSSYNLIFFIFSSFSCWGAGRFLIFSSSPPAGSTSPSSSSSTSPSSSSSTICWSAPFSSSTICWSPPFSSPSTICWSSSLCRYLLTRVLRRGTPTTSFKIELKCLYFVPTFNPFLLIFNLIPFLPFHSQSFSSFSLFSLFPPTWLSLIPFLKSN